MTRDPLWLPRVAPWDRPFGRLQAAPQAKVTEAVIALIQDGR